MRRPTYITKCHRCGNDVERTYRQKDVKFSCFPCKRSMNAEYYKKRKLAESKKGKKWRTIPKLSPISLLRK